MTCCALRAHESQLSGLYPHPQHLIMITAHSLCTCSHPCHDLSLHITLAVSSKMQPGNTSQLGPVAHGVSPFQ